MCDCHEFPERMMAVRKCINALHCPTRWTIIDLIGDEQKSTSDILAEMRKSNAGLTAAGLYYHLSALKSAGIIEVAAYKEEKGGSPEKVWKLKIRQIVIDLLSDGGKPATVRKRRRRRA